MKHELSMDYPSVAFGTYHSYGGSQLWSDQQTLREVGCGVIAAVDLWIYLCRKTPGHRMPAFTALPLAQDPLPLAEYRALANQMRLRFFPLIPRLGINGLVLAAGVNVLLRRSTLPYRARWYVPYARLWEKIAEMLDRDIPVILSVGPNFPLFWQKHTLSFYLRHQDGHFQPGASTRAHYVTVTGMDEHWLQISSWGKKYYLSKKDYLDYVRRHSARLTSNILYIQKTDRRV